MFGVARSENQLLDNKPPKQSVSWGVRENQVPGCGLAMAGRVRPIVHGLVWRQWWVLSLKKGLSCLKAIRSFSESMIRLIWWIKTTPLSVTYPKSKILGDCNVGFVYELLKLLWVNPGKFTDWATYFPWGWVVKFLFKKRTPLYIPGSFRDPKM